MKSILKLAASGLLCIVGGYVLAYLAVFDALYKMVRMIRYGFLKVIASVIRVIKPNPYLVEVWNKTMCKVMENDSVVTTKINGLIVY